jgi:hypothetical protein
MEKVIIKLGGENRYWLAETLGTTKDINKAYHYTLKEAHEIIGKACANLKIIDIPGEGRVTIRTRNRYWTGCFGTFSEDRAEAVTFDRKDAEDFTRNYNEDTVVEDVDIDEKDKFKGGWGPDGYLERPINEFEDLSGKSNVEWTHTISDNTSGPAINIHQDLDLGVQGEFEGILTSLNSLLEYKNKKYGNVALDPLNIFAKYGGIGQRLDDKLSRIKNAEELRKNDVADMLGYLVLLCKENGFENFDEFKD